MAKSNWGITSGFTGKLGNVVGFNWKGKNIQRALVKGTDARTEKQLYGRTKFAQLGKLSGIVYDAIYEGYRKVARDNRSTQGGLFIKNNIDAFNGATREALAIDLTKLQLSDGNLKGVVCGAPSLSEGVITVEVSNTAAINRRSAATDRVYLCAYCPKLEDAVCACVGTRQGGSFELTVPADYADAPVYVYAFVIGAASTNEGIASKTIYVGSISDGVVETPAPSTGSGTGSETPSGGNSGGAETPANTLAAPVISGTTPFEETTQVTITGPDGAQIRYTTSGIDPIATSNLYSEPLTLSATTTVKAIAIKDGVTSAVATKIFSLSGDGEYDPNEGDMG